MKKSLSLLLICMLCVALFLTACGGGGTQSSDADPSAPPADEQNSEEGSEDIEEENEEPANSGKLVMATEAGFKPYEYYGDDNKIVGVDVDIAQAIADEMGLELVIENMEFGAIIPAIQSGKADFGAAGISITEERAKVVDFTVEYATSMQVILTTSGSGIAGEADLDGKVVGVQLGTVADLVLSDEEEFPNIAKVAQYNKYFEAANDLKNGRIDAIVLDALPAQEIQRMDENFVVLEQELFTDVYAFCVKQGNDELLESINTVMQKLMDEGKIEEFTAAHIAD